MTWRPVDVTAALFPETLVMLKSLEPAVAAFCRDCGELWVVVHREE